MKKIALLFLVLSLAVLTSGCLREAYSGDVASSASLLKVKEKPDKFTFEKALDQNNKAFEFAFSDKDLMADDSFLTYIEAAKIAQEASLASEAWSSSSRASSSYDDAMAAVQDFNEVAEPFFSSVGTSLGSLFSGFTTTLSSSTSGSSSTSSSSASGTSGSSSGSSSGTSSSGGSGTSSSGGATQTQTNTDYQSLMSLYAQFQVYQADANSIISQANTNPWSARDLVISDQTLVNLFSSSYAIFDFIKAHPTVSEGDKVLASVGDTLTSIYTLWGLGRYEAQTAYLMINYYYPAGSYVAHAEQQLSLL